MNNLQVGQIAGAGMDFERARLEMATLKLALMNMSFTSNPEALNFLSQLEGVNKAGILNTSNEPMLETKRHLDASNPMADAEGYVYKFAIDPTREMATLISATRAYEANVRAYNANSMINKAALDIGAK